MPGPLGAAPDFTLQSGDLVGTPIQGLLQNTDAVATVQRLDLRIAGHMRWRPGTMRIRGKHLQMGHGHGLDIRLGRLRGKLSADAGQRLRIGHQRGDAAPYSLGIRLDQQSVPAVVDALGQRAHAGGNHRQTQAAHFRQRVAEGLGHGRQDQRCIGLEGGQQLRQFVALVVQQHMHTGLAEKVHAFRAGTQKNQFGVFRERGQHRVQQVGALAAAHPSRHHQAKALARWWLGQLHRVRPCSQTVRDDGTAQRLQLRRQPQFDRHGAGAGGNQAGPGTKGSIDKGAPQCLPMCRIAMRKLESRARIGQRAVQTGLIKDQCWITEIAMQHRPQRVVVMHHQAGRQAGPQRVQGMPDQGRHDHGVDAEIGHNRLQKFAIAGMMDGAVGNAVRRLEAAPGRAAAARIGQREAFAVAAAAETAMGLQQQMVVRCISLGKIPHPAGCTTTPTVVDVQNHRLAVETRQARSGRVQIGHKCLRQITVQAIGPSRPWLRCASGRHQQVLHLQQSPRRRQRIAIEREIAWTEQRQCASAHGDQRCIDPRYLERVTAAMHKTQGIQVCQCCRIDRHLDAGQQARLQCRHRQRRIQGQCGTNPRRPAGWQLAVGMNQQHIARLGPCRQFAQGSAYIRAFEAAYGRAFR